MNNNYFNDLNYTLANEETRVEYELLKENSDHVFSICGSGARCLPLLAKNPKHLTVVDLSPYQLLLFELRLAAIRSLSYEEYLFFIGYRGGLVEGKISGDSRREIFDKIQLPEKSRNYWLSNSSAWEKSGFILLGKWERHFQKLGHIIRDYLLCDFSVIFSAQSLEEQIEQYKKHWPQWRWSFLLKIVASEFVFNKFLYKGHFSGRKKVRTESKSPSTFIISEFRRIFHTQLVRKNYFMQILLLGRVVYEEGLPLEATRHIFEKIKTSTSEIEICEGNLLDYLDKHPYDFISLSDTISYLPTDKANLILQHLQPTIAKHSQVVIRSFLKKPQSLNDNGWQRQNDSERWARNIDGTAVYEFLIFMKK